MNCAFVLCTAVFLAPPYAFGQVLAEGEATLAIAMDIVDDRPFLPVEIDGTAGKMMFDNGTPDAMFLNRATLRLPDAPEVGRGFAASGQPIIVQVHPAPAARIGGRAITLPEQVPSGNFGFTEVLYGTDFLGFIGTPMVENGAFLLDYDRRVLTLIRTDADGQMAVPPPPDREVLASIAFAIWPGGQPTTAALVGGLPILADFDTGDVNTLYLRPATREVLIEAGVLQEAKDAFHLTGLVLAGYAVPPQDLHVVEAGGPDDFRATGQSDFLRLGSWFLDDQPTLWNFPARRLDILAADGRYDPTP